jgi:hypothetical protein
VTDLRTKPTRRHPCPAPEAAANGHARAAVEQAFLAILRARHPSLTWTLIRNHGQRHTQLPAAANENKRSAAT